MQEDRKECQICERKIKAKSGLIAHHGYQRPGYGWQTASCPGAKELPYEVSCDLIPPVIESIKSHIEFLTEKRAEMLATPPQTLTTSPMYGQPEDLQKPENFDSEKCMQMVTFRSFDQQYESEFKRQIRGIDQALKQCADDVVRLEARVANWVYKG